MSAAHEIRSRLSRTEILAQLAEECSELAQAALKLRRAIRGDNPTPVTVDEAEAKVTEEVADVLLCIMAAGDYVQNMIVDRELKRIMDKKASRWVFRLMGGGV